MINTLFKNLYRKSTINRITNKWKLLSLDSKIEPIGFLNIRLFSSIIVFILFMVFSDRGYIYAPLFTLLIYFGFEYFIDYKIKLRANKLNYEAIFFFQVLVLTLESGKDLKGAIELTSKNIYSEISEEFKKTMLEVDIGRSLTEALIGMKERIPSEEINTVLLNLTQSTIFGNDIIESLNNQIDYLRDKKILTIKASINKMPVKVSVISVFFIIPIIMLLVLGPVIINFLIK